VNTVAKTESGTDAQQGTLALCEHDTAEHCQGSIHDFHEPVDEVVADSAASCRGQASLQNTKVQRPFRHSSP